MIRDRYIKPGEYEAPFDFDFTTAYRVDGRDGIAWNIYGYEAEADEDSEWSGIYPPTGRLVGHMIGDDRTETFDPDELVPISEEEYCSECGQLGCGWC